jgi:CheY-like chemotaxis protein
VRVPGGPYVGSMKSRRRILVADDSPVVRKMLCELFEDHPSLEICDEAADGREAVDKAIQHRPELIILDLSMPVMNGIEAAKLICAVLPKVPIILFTMHAESIKNADIEIFGINRVVSKRDMETLVGHAEELALAA